MFNEVDEDGDDCVTRALGGWQRGLEAGQPQLSRSSLAPPPHELLALPPSCRPTGLQQQRTCGAGSCLPSTQMPDECSARVIGERGLLCDLRARQGASVSLVSLKQVAGVSRVLEERHRQWLRAR